MALDRIWLPISLEDHIAPDGMTNVASGMPLGYISEKEWGMSLEKIVSPECRRIFGFIEYSESDKKMLQDMQKPDGITSDGVIDKDKYVYAIKKVDFSKIDKTITDKWNDPNIVKPVIKKDQIPVDVFKDSASLTQDIKGAVNAWNGGSVTWGAGGTYATLALLAADLAQFASNGTATQISAVTETAQTDLGLDINGNNVVIDGAHFLTNHAWAAGGANSYIIVSADSNGGGSIKLCNMNILATIAATGNCIFILNSQPAGDNAAMTICDSFCDCDNKAYSGIAVSDARPVLHIYNNICYEGRWYCAYVAGSINADSIWDGNTLAECVNDFSFSGNSKAFKMVNNWAGSDAGDYKNVGALTTFSKCASEDATGSEASLQNLDRNTAFQSVTNGDASFYLPVRSGVLDGTGATPLVTARTLYYNDVAIDTDNVYIGAKGLAPLATVGKSIIGITSGVGIGI